MCGTPNSFDLGETFPRVQRRAGPATWHQVLPEYFARTPPNKFFPKKVVSRLAFASAMTPLCLVFWLPAFTRASFGAAPEQWRPASDAQRRGLIAEIHELKGKVFG